MKASNTYVDESAEPDVTRSSRDGYDEYSNRVIGRYQGLLKEQADPHEWAFAWRTELNRGGFPAYEMLREEVVDPGRCVGCAACVSICPVDVFDYVDEQPVETRADACVNCVLCVEVCPVLRPVDNDMHEFIDLQEPSIDEGYGPYAYGLYARSTDPEIMQYCQDGLFVLELRGSPALEYRGNCRLSTVDGKQRKVVLRGLIPKEHAFRADFLTCRVQKFDAVGRLKARLYANGKQVARATTAAPFNWVGIRGDGPWGRASGWRGNQRLLRFRGGDQPRSAPPRDPSPPLSGTIVPPLTGPIVPPLQ